MASTPSKLLPRTPGSWSSSSRGLTASTEPTTPLNRSTGSSNPPLKSGGHGSSSSSNSGPSSSSGLNLSNNASTGSFTPSSAAAFPKFTPKGRKPAATVASQPLAMGAQVGFASHLSSPSANPSVFIPSVFTPSHFTPSPPLSPRLRTPRTSQSTHPRLSSSGSTASRSESISLDLANPPFTPGGEIQDSPVSGLERRNGFKGDSGRGEGEEERGEEGRGEEGRGEKEGSEGKGEEEGNRGKDVNRALPRSENEGCERSGSREGDRENGAASKREAAAAAAAAAEHAAQERGGAERVPREEGDERGGRGVSGSHGGSDPSRIQVKSITNPTKRNRVLSADDDDDGNDDGNGNGNGDGGAPKPKVGSKGLFHPLLPSPASAASRPPPRPVTPRRLRRVLTCISIAVLLLLASAATSLLTSLWILSVVQDTLVLGPAAFPSTAASLSPEPRSRLWWGEGSEEGRYGWVGGQKEMSHRGRGGRGGKEGRKGEEAFDLVVLPLSEFRRRESERGDGELRRGGRSENETDEERGGREGEGQEREGEEREGEEREKEIGGVRRRKGVSVTEAFVLALHEKIQKAIHMLEDN